jgi:hypothetical protein
MTISVIVLVVMIAAVAALAVYRKVVARNEDDLVHLADGSEVLIANQKKTEQSLSLIDRAGVTLTVATAVYGVALAGMILYSGLTRPSL